MGFQSGFEARERESVFCVVAESSRAGGVQAEEEEDLRERAGVTT